MHDINNLLVFERQTLRKTTGSIQCKKGCRIRNNNKFQKSTEGEDIIKHIKGQRLTHVGL